LSKTNRNPVYRAARVAGVAGPEGRFGSGAALIVQDNTVTGFGPVDYIAQNGIQISFGATAKVAGNVVTGNDYTPHRPRSLHVAC
jgi:L-aminopeptidase/D-esterase-like protein